VFNQGPIPAFVHGLLDYATAVLLIAAPFVFAFDSDTATGIAIAAGVVVLIVNASTAMSTGLIKSIPVPAHVMLDYLAALFLIAAPFLFGFDSDSSATAFFLVLGVVHLLLTIATRFIREERPPKQRRPPDALKRPGS
jgi:hypothetical protein